MTRSKTKRDSDEDIDLHTLISEVVAEPETWLNTPNDQLGGKKPKELMGTTRELQLRELVRSIKHGMPT